MSFPSPPLSVMLHLGVAVVGTESCAAIGCDKATAPGATSRGLDTHSASVGCFLWGQAERQGEKIWQHLHWAGLLKASQATWGICAPPGKGCPVGRRGAELAVSLRPKPS